MPAFRLMDRHAPFYSREVLAWWHQKWIYFKHVVASRCGKKGKMGIYVPGLEPPIGALLALRSLSCGRVGRSRRTKKNIYFFYFAHAHDILYWKKSLFIEVRKNKIECNLVFDSWSLGCTVIEIAPSKLPWSQYEGVVILDLGDVSLNFLCILHRYTWAPHRKAGYTHKNKYTYSS